MKAIAIISVVIGHVLSGCYSDSMSSMNDMLVFKFVYSFHMPLFMFISGFVCFKPEKAYSLSDIGWRCVSYMTPFFVVAFLLGLMRNEITLLQYWYFRTLTILMLVLYTSVTVTHMVSFIRKEPDSNYHNIIICILFYVGIKSIEYVSARWYYVSTTLDIGHIIQLYPFFLAGYIYRSFKSLDRVLRNDYTLSLSLLALFIVYKLDYNKFHIQAIVAIIFVLNISSLTIFNKLSSLKSIGNKTQPIYIIHFFLVMAFPQIGDFFMSFKDCSPKVQVLPQLLYSIPMSLIIIYISLKITEVIKCSPMLSLLALGDVKEIKNKFCKKSKNENPI